MPQRLQIINDTIEEFTTGLPHDTPMQIASDIRRAIDYVFQESHNINDILAALKETRDVPNTPANIVDWAKRTEKTILMRSPTSVKVTLHMLRAARRWNIVQAFQQEYHIAARFMEHPDFIEGVTARLIRKPAQTPNWTPATLDLSLIHI